MGKGGKKMKNREIHGYNSLPVSDTHIHIIYPKSPDETVDILRKYRNHFEYDSITIQTLTRCSGHRATDPSNTLKGLYVREILNREVENSAYVYGNVFHHFDERDTAESYFGQVKEMYELGVDGYKLLDGKPSVRKALGKPLCDPVYDKMYGFIEEKGMPVKLHLADPAKFWEPKESMTEMAIKRGWWCGDGTYPARDEFYEETYGIMRKFPKLKLCLAHLGYMTYDEAVVFLEMWDNTSFDLTPGATWCYNATQEPEKWKQFFAKYADRIFFGTDTYNNLEGEDNEQGYERSSSRYNVVRKMLEKQPNEIIEYGSDLGDFTPLAMSEDVLAKIYYKNQRALLGNPKPLNKARFIKCAERLKSEYKAGVYGMLPADEIRDELLHLDAMTAKI